MKKYCHLRGIGINVGVKPSTVFGGLWWSVINGEKPFMHVYFSGETNYEYRPWTERGFIVRKYGGGICPDSVDVYFDAEDFHMYFETDEEKFDELTEEIFKD